MMQNESMRAIGRTRWVGIAGVILLLGAIGLPGVAHGEEKREAPAVKDFLGGKSFAVQTGTTLYAWSDEGETVDVNFERARITEKVKQDGTVVVTDPSGEVRGECVIKKSGKSGKSCDLSDLAAPSAGIWRVDYRASGDGKAIPANWNVAVNAGGRPISGRVWTDRYQVYQDPGDGARIDLYYVSEGGYQYRAVFRGYNGLWSKFEAGVAGLTRPDTCQPLNHSPGGMSGDFSTDLAACGIYKIFFEAPAKDLPGSARVAGGNETWVVNPVREPKLGEVVYQPGGPNQVAGDFLVTVTDHQGTVNLELDLNGDGDFGDDVDRIITWGVSVVGTQQVAIPWDGMAGNEKPVRNNRDIQARGSIDRIGSIYFVNSDVEGRSGGIEVEYLNGPNAGDRTVYWDDSPDPEATNAADQSGHVDSLGGARSWAFSTRSWGNDRHIQDWSFVEAEITGEVLAVTTPPRPPKHSDAAAGAATAWWQGPFGWVAAAGVVTSVLGLSFLLFSSRRSNRRDDGEESQLVGLP
ncbi:hypothetical protein FB566_5246 [Stackebrandtia endophytica]|uniref:Uncharacterized protein n=2 Tax=Stackebrandtia endophytica TaxID=1496996 RepID=A0A543B486_9ACTN|nr:hypothetical protein FB566_5246 [Stackebrandtia endophytica]